MDLFCNISSVNLNCLSVMCDPHLHLVDENICTKYKFKEFVVQSFTTFTPMKLPDCCTCVSFGINNDHSGSDLLDKLSDLCEMNPHVTTLRLYDNWVRLDDKLFTNIRTLFLYSCDSLGILPCVERVYFGPQFATAGFVKLMATQQTHFPMLKEIYIYLEAFANIFHWPTLSPNIGINIYMRGLMPFEPRYFSHEAYYVAKPSCGHVRFQWGPELADFAQLITVDWSKACKFEDIPDSVLNRRILPTKET